MEIRLGCAPASERESVAEFAGLKEEKDPRETRNNGVVEDEDDEIPEENDILELCEGFIKTFDPNQNAEPIRGEGLPDDICRIYPQYSFYYAGGDDLRDCINWLRTTTEGKELFQGELRAFPFGTFVCTTPRICHDKGLSYTSPQRSAYIPSYELFEIMLGSHIRAGKALRYLVMRVRSGELGPDPFWKEIGLFEQMFEMAQTRMRETRKRILKEFGEFQRQINACVQGIEDGIAGGPMSKKDRDSMRFYHEVSDMSVSKAFAEWLISYEWFIWKAINLKVLVECWIHTYFVLKKASYMEKMCMSEQLAVFQSSRTYAQADGFAKNAAKLADMDYFASDVRSDFFMKSAYAEERPFTEFFGIKPVGKYTEDEARQVTTYAYMIEKVLKGEEIAAPDDIVRAENPSPPSQQTTPSPPSESPPLFNAPTKEEHEALVRKMGEMGLGYVSAGVGALGSIEVTVSSEMAENRMPAIEEDPKEESKMEEEEDTVFVGEEDISVNVSTI